MMMLTSGYLLASNRLFVPVDHATETRAGKEAP